MRKLFIVVAIFTLSILSFGKEYRRIASGSPAISEILYELGLKDSIVAPNQDSADLYRRHDNCRMPPPVR